MTHTTKCVLINPPGLQRGLNVGLGYLAATLHKAGYDVMVLDFNNRRDRIVERIAKSVRNASLIGFSITSFTLEAATNILALLRKILKRPSCESPLLVAGGPHATLDYKSLLETTDFHVSVIGEANTQ